VGLITKHGDPDRRFANQLRVKGVDKMDALVKRPPCDCGSDLDDDRGYGTGAVPLRWLTAPGAESRQAIGWGSRRLLLGACSPCSLIPPMLARYAKCICRAWRTRKLSCFPASAGASMQRISENDEPGR
jgi:hypothetical protein